MSLRRRLVLLSAAAVAVAVCAASLAAYLATRSELRGQVDNALERQAETAAEIVPGEPGPLSGRFEQRLRDRFERQGPPEGGAFPGPGPGPPPPPGGEDLIAQRLAADGEALGSRGGGELPVGEADRAIARAGMGRAAADATVSGEHLRVVTVGLPAGGAVQLARSLEGVDEVLADLRSTLVLVVLAGIALAAALAAALARTVIRPIDRLTAAAEHVGATEDLSQRIEVERDDEIGRLAVRFNTMLAAIESGQEALTRSLTAQSQLVADASHELRTPVASLRTDIEVLLKHPQLDPAERERLLAGAERRVAELGELIGDVIELARGERRDEAAEEVRLDELAGEAVARMRDLAPERHFELELEPTVLTARADRLARALNNLLDNAHKYSPPEEPIEVRVAGGEVSVRDHGPGIPPAEIEHVFDRFWRGAGSREAAGSGLGLAIVRQVAEAHGGEVSAENAPDGGAVFRLRFAA